MHDEKADASINSDQRSLRRSVVREQRQCLRCKRVLARSMFVPERYANGRAQRLCVDCFERQRKDQKQRLERELKSGFAVCRECKQLVSLDKMTRKVGFPGYHHLCRKCNNEKTKGYRAQNPDKARAISRTAQARLLEKIKSDPNSLLRYRLTTRLRSHLRRIVASGKYRGRQALAWLGCDVDHFRRHIESLFDVGMAWENSSQWHIDHIKPLCWCRSEEEFAAAWHYTNLRPLWAKDNLSRPKRRTA